MISMKLKKVILELNEFTKQIKVKYSDIIV